MATVRLRLRVGGDTFTGDDRVCWLRWRPTRAAAWPAVSPPPIRRRRFPRTRRRALPAASTGAGTTAADCEVGAGQQPARQRPCSSHAWSTGSTRRRHRQALVQGANCCPGSRPHPYSTCRWFLTSLTVLLARFTPSTRRFIAHLTPRPPTAVAAWKILRVSQGRDTRTSPRHSGPTERPLCGRRADCRRRPAVHTGWW